MAMLPVYLLLSLLFFAAPSAQYKEYNLTSVYNTGALLDLDNGLKGRFAGFEGNITSEAGAGYVQHGMFFITKDGYGYNLAVLAYDITNGDSYSAEIIWQADQSRLVGDGAVLEFSDGNMLLKDSDDVIVWQTYTQNRGVKFLQVSNRGNVVLVNSTGNIHNKIWQTFDSPTDTLVCTQVLKQGMSLSSGNYSLFLEPNRLALFYKSSLVSKQWSWNDSLKSSVFLAFCCDQSNLLLQLRTDMEYVNEFNKLQPNGNCTNTSEVVVHNILELKSSNEFSFAAFVRLEEEGQITATKWVIRKQQFKKCELLTSCGSYGLCSTTGCSCPNSSYFEPSVASKPEAGCKLKSNSTSGLCHSYSLTDTIQGIDYIVNQYSPYHNLSTVKECRTLCLENATCKAAFYQTHTNLCFQASQIETLQSRNSSYLAFFKICMDGNPSLGISNRVAAIIGVCAGLPLLGLLAAAIIGFIWWKRFKDEDFDGILDSCLSETTLKRFTYKELEQMTNGFSVMLGKGGFGSVHKGVLSDGTLVAVKKLEGNGQRGSEFYAEMSILSRVHHMNLVQLIGFCADKSRRALVYEYMPNGSLDKWLRPINQLDWNTKLTIARGAARGLAYLHEECNERIVHLDMKPQNILLGENFYPKVGDFGLSKLGDKDQSFVMTTVRGTRGYLAPEWFIEGSTISGKSDVYSFGVVLLELITGSKPMEIHAKHLWESSQNQDIMFQIVNRSICKSMNLEEVKLVMKVAALCVQLDPHARPSMSQVVEILEGKIEVPQLGIGELISSITIGSNESFITSTSWINSSALIPSIISTNCDSCRI